MSISVDTFPAIASARRSGDAREISRAYLARLCALEEGTAAHSQVRGALIEVNISLVEFVASRFKRRMHEDREDIIQVGTIGLIKAIDRFELSRETEFTSFAIPCISGEIKRHFRDTSWAVHVPRRLQEARLHLSRATEELRTRLGRAPTTAELAELMQLGHSEITEVQKAANGYNSVSVDAAVSGLHDESQTLLANFIGMDEDRYELIENMQTLAPLIAGLQERDRLLLHLRFVEELTQQAISEAIGCSQMHVSRLLIRIIAELRAGILQGH
ncbi:MULTISPECIES: SigB/SigF/SigG family RNA polymerase sigma factor [unclassified Streptomyces]|uniref:SigB/SigF/SigG family RNA polymerase sigma factor n=1 Tax=unclassified Streptomyces TaxID=2593676 RepID=UPI000DBAAE58|nr:MULTISPECIES: SigB/SigF/SigG family RNA polymerase sigma factor [unclassified Streptomyces]MYT73460.1 SigB/SigF/SigG family RNA polymerase sigma factor [Streptomyces sp. SID8367]RAJ84990.1 RNA polymerase sigma-B factor [Streptomyces sp. PsTaAH-137]